MRYSLTMVAPAPSSTSTLAASLAMNATEAVMGSSSSGGASSSGTSSGSSPAKFNPSMAIIIVVLLGTFFFMGFLSVYVKKCVTTEGEYMDHQYWAAAAAAAAESSSAAGGWVVHNLGAPSQGLDKSLIHALPIVGFSKARECCVCLGDFQDTDSLRLLPRCGHTFHVECIDTWLVSHTTCPLCRFQLTAETVLVPVAEPAAQEQEEQEQGLGLGRPMHQGVDGEISVTGTDAGDAAQADLTVEDPSQPECSDDDRSRLRGVLRKVWELFLARFGSTGLGRVVQRA